jgi:hypothetical protein
MSIKSDKILARYIWKKNYYDTVSMTVEPNAFLPKDGEVSLANITKMTEQEIWQYGDKKITKTPGVIKARADNVANNIYACGLVLSPDDDKSIHVNIKGWPSEYSECLLFAEELARISTLVVRP